jgi:hypothetical protein
MATVEVPISVTTIFIYNDTIFRSLWWHYNQVLLYILGGCLFVDVYVFDYYVCFYCSSYMTVSTSSMYGSMERNKELRTCPIFFSWSTRTHLLMQTNTMCSHLCCGQQVNGLFTTQFNINTNKSLRSYSEVPVNHDSMILPQHLINDVTSCIKMPHESDTLKQVFWYYTVANLR